MADVVISGSMDSQTPNDLTFVFGHLRLKPGVRIFSFPMLDPIQKASVLVSLSLRPERLPKSSNKRKDAIRVSLEPSEMSVVSSAY